MAKIPTLQLVKEQKLADLIDPPRAGAVYEASGVIANGAHCSVVLDNVRRVARIALHLRHGSNDHQWVGTTRQGEGYEAITYNRRTGRFYLMIEAQKHPDGTFKGAIDEYDDNGASEAAGGSIFRSRSAIPDSRGSPRSWFAGSIISSRCARAITAGNSGSAAAAVFMCSSGADASGSLSRASSCPGMLHSKISPAWRFEAIVLLSCPRNHRGSGWAGFVRRTGQSPAEAASTTFLERKKARSSITPSRGFPGSRLGRLSRCPIYARRGIRSAPPGPTSRFTYSESPDDCQSGNPNAMIAEPAAIATCCLLSNT